MDKQIFLELLHRYLNDKATGEEERFLIKYYDLFSDEPDVVALMDDLHRKKLKNDIKAAIFRAIDDDVEPGKKTLPFKAVFLRIAAAAVVVGFLATGVLFFRGHTDKPQAAHALVRQQKSNLFITLSDGSSVILSYGSKLRYATTFTGLPKREVYLEGQAYFDIKHDASKPFIVHTGKVETTVLGTAFNIKAMPDDKIITVTVTRGRVKVSDQQRELGVIIPNQQIIYNKAELNATQSKIDAKVITNWTSQENLYFEDVTVAEAAKLLEQRFKVKIIFKDQIVLSKRFTSTFDNTASLDKDLKSICEFNEASYTYDKDKSTITIISDPQTN